MRMVQLNDLLPRDQWESNWTFYGEDHEGLPDDAEYAIFEFYCENGDCDCQSLIADIMQLGEDGKTIDKPLAIVNYDWSSKKTLCYPTLHEQSPQTPVALDLLEVFKKFIHYEEYLMRVKKQYAQVKQLVCEKQIKNLSSEMEALEREMSTLKHAGRNDLCPCGSNIKYKKCCLKY